MKDEEELGKEEKEGSRQREQHVQRPRGGSGKSLRTFRKGKEEASALKEAEEAEPWVPD